jgi:hypothetical protein
MRDSLAESQLILAQAFSAVTEAMASTKTMQTSTRDIVATLEVPAAVTVLNVGGVTTVGDGEAGLYVRVDTEPTSTAKVQSADGQWWSLVPPTSITVSTIISAGSSITADTTVNAGTVVSAGTSMDSPLYQVAGTQVVGPQIVGWGDPTGSASRAAFSAGTVTLTSLAAHVGQLIKDLKTHGLLGD